MAALLGPGDLGVVVLGRGSLLANVWCEHSPSAVGGRMYVDSLIGPDTVTRLPEATIALFEDHGRLARTIDVNVEEAEDMMSRLGAVSVDLDNVGLALDTEGVVSFHESFREVLAALEAKARQFTRH